MSMSINPMDTEKLISGDHPLWSQSYYFNFYDPKSKVGGITRIGVFEHRKEANDWFIFFKDGKPLYTRINGNLAYTAARPDPGMEVAGIRLTSIAPLMKARIEYSSPDFAVDLLCEGLQPMVDCVALSRDEAGALAAEMAYIHMEGTFRITGSITLRDGERIEIDGTGLRDVSAGPRNWDYLLSYNLAWPVFSNGMAFVGVHAISTHGTNAYFKIFYDGKQWSPIKRVEDRNEYEKDGMTIRSLHWRFWDSSGQMFEINGKPLCSFPCPLDGFVVNGHMMEYKLADGTVGYGLAEAAFRYDSLTPGPVADIRLANTFPPLPHS
jgi:hypothetical protein